MCAAARHFFIFITTRNTIICQNTKLYQITKDLYNIVQKNINIVHEVSECLLVAVNMWVSMVDPATCTEQTSLEVHMDLPEVWIRQIRH